MGTQNNDGIMTIISDVIDLVMNTKLWNEDIRRLKAIICR